MKRALGRALAAAALLGAAASSLPACKDDGGLDEAAEELKDEAGDAADEVKDEVDDHT